LDRSQYEAPAQGCVDIVMSGGDDAVARVLFVLRLSKPALWKLWLEVQ
jgi:hypothetical protein